MIGCLFAHLPVTDPGHDRVVQLNLELRKMVFKIWELARLYRFLLPSHAQPIIGNASEYSCNAPVVFSDKNPVQPLPLSVTREDVRELTSRLRALNKLAKMQKLSEMKRLWNTVVSQIFVSSRQHTLVGHA